ncbi:hypothetical protein E4U46_006387 [Claviceps purpurea]|nr:hypothetical protein E4U28_006213 [Claviceps purpurea]KAG6156347.1 hypothetical protein E4U37_000420 [Claviceps purpurea]KAG6162339.1 hypothetical protein E4U51_006437 [Claviceps purpurea]KAG6169088.1 hypothetical protein E4U27_007651 [Claviceps purpurea]KAG6177981.1 hypothetical protein E4U10_008343 [Claviceps purpurea]
MKDLLVGPDTIFLNLFRLDHTEFGVLLKWARDTGTQDDKNFTVWQKLMVFLHIIGHHVSYRNVSNRFRMSIATINRIFNEVLVALAHNLSTAVSFKSLESDMRKALTLITESGNYYDDATGVIETADEKWEEFERNYGDKAKAIRNKGIPWVESLTKQVWPDARPTGEGYRGRKGLEASRILARKRPTRQILLLIQRRRRPRARVAITPATQQSTIPKRRHHRLDQLLPQRSFLSDILDADLNRPPQGIRTL